jgi:hypothetical protein
MNLLEISDADKATDLERPREAAADEAETHKPQAKRFNIDWVKHRKLNK